MTKKIFAHKLAKALESLITKIKNNELIEATIYQFEYKDGILEVEQKQKTILPAKEILRINKISSENN